MLAYIPYMDPMGCETVPFYAPTISCGLLEKATMEQLGDVPAGHGHDYPMKSHRIPLPSGYLT